MSEEFATGWNRSTPSERTKQMLAEGRNVRRGKYLCAEARCRKPAVVLRNTASGGIVRYCAQCAANRVLNDRLADLRRNR